MKKITLSLIAVIITGLLFAQQLQVSPKNHIMGKTPVNNTKATVATLTYSSDNVSSNLGLGAPADFI